MKEKELADLAGACWNLENWLKKQTGKNQAVRSALRKYKALLESNDIEILDLTGQQFSEGLAVSVINNESEEDDEDNLIIIKMVKPVVLQNGRVIQSGQVILSDHFPVPVERLEKSAPVPDIEPVKFSETKPHTWMKSALVIMVIFLFLETGLLFSAFRQTSKIPAEETAIPETLRPDLLPESKSTEVNQSIENLPAPDDIKDEVDLIHYYVQYGDTLSQICLSLGIDWNESSELILTINDLKSADYLQTGQMLKLPAEREK